MRLWWGWESMGSPMHRDWGPICNRAAQGQGGSWGKGQEQSTGGPCGCWGWVRGLVHCR